jgi:sialic acid synthase SpsE
MEQLRDIGIHLIKFQLFTKDQVKDLPEYLPKVLKEGDAQYLFDKGKELGVDVFFSVCYPEAVDICERIGVKYYKIRYKDRHNKEILDKIPKTKTTFISAPFRAPSKNRVYLYCIPSYPADITDYILYKGFEGISDHTSGLMLYKVVNSTFPVEYFEMHVKEDDNCLESKWSKKISDLAEVIA